MVFSSFSKQFSRSFVLVGLSLAVGSIGSADVAAKRKKKSNERKPAQVTQTLDQALQEAIEERKIATENFRQAYSKDNTALDPFKVMPAQKIGQKKKTKGKKAGERLPADEDNFDLDE